MKKRNNSTITIAIASLWLLIALYIFDFLHIYFLIERLSFEDKICLPCLHQSTKLSFVYVTYLIRIACFQRQLVKVIRILKSRRVNRWRARMILWRNCTITRRRPNEIKRGKVKGIRTKNYQANNIAPINSPPAKPWSRVMASFYVIENKKTHRDCKIPCVFILIVSSLFSRHRYLQQLTFYFCVLHSFEHNRTLAIKYFNIRNSIQYCNDPDILHCYPTYFGNRPNKVYCP